MPIIRHLSPPCGAQHPAKGQAERSTTTMNHLTPRERLFIALQLHNWSYCMPQAFNATNRLFRDCAAFFWK